LSHTRQSNPTGLGDMVDRTGWPVR
jgi:hypothetical protein